MLFFTAPPVAVENSTGAATGHSVRYLAEKARRAETLAQKRQERDLQQQTEERVAKKARLGDQTQTEKDIEALKIRALSVMEKQLGQTVDGQLGDRDVEALRAAQKAIRERVSGCGGEWEEEGGQEGRGDWQGGVF